MTNLTHDADRTKAAHTAAMDMYHNSKLSARAAVALFYSLSCELPVKLKSEVFKELVRARLITMAGLPSKAALTARVELQMAIQAAAGCNLLPETVPTNIITQGHKLIKGSSRLKRETRLAEQTMINTGYKINEVVWAHVLANPIKWENGDKAVVSVLHAFVDTTMYFPVSYDYRGRMYYRAGIVTPQGNDMLKGLLQFAEEAPIGRNGRVAIQRALYDAMGIKGSRDAQLAQLEESGLDGALNGDHGYLALQLAAELEDIDQWVSEGNEAADYLSGVVCHQDATCSGLQIASAITGHRRTAEATNCTASHVLDEKQDVYQLVADELAVHGSMVAHYAATYGRDFVKKAVMTMGYGAGEATLVRSCEEWLLMSHNIVHEFTDVETQQLMIALNEHCGATNALKEVLQKVAEGSTDLSWTTHDGFLVKQEKKSGTVETFENVSMEFDKLWDESDNICAIAPNFVHSLDAAQMRAAIVRLGDIPVAAIHDSLGTRPCDYFKAASTVRHAFVDINSQQIAKEFINHHDKHLPILGNYQATEANESAWFWC